MRRREFITLLSGTAVWSLGADAQPAKLPTIGFLAPSSLWNSWTNAFVQRLRELGWIEGQNIVIERRWAEGRPERFAEIATEFVNSNVDVIVTGGNAVSAVRQDIDYSDHLCPGCRPRWQRVC